MTNGAKIRITVLAATKMYSGVCVAGIDGSNKWVRPLSSGGLNFTPQSLSAGNSVVVEPYNEIEFRVHNYPNNSPQSEDVQVYSGTPTLLRTINDDELRALMARNDEHDSVERHADDLEPWLVSENRSLVLTRVDRPLRAYRNSFKPDQRRISFQIGGTTLDLPCTDLRWRRSTNGAQDSIAFEKLKSAEILYFTLGLARKLDDHYWPMVVGIHPIPRMEIKVDYGNL